MKTGLIGTAVLAASVALAGCATSPGYGSGYGNSGYGNSGYGRPANCYDCGTVTRIETVRGNSNPNIAGPLIGGVVGAVVRHQQVDVALTWAVIRAQQRTKQIEA